MIAAPLLIGCEALPTAQLGGVLQHTSASSVPELYRPLQNQTNSTSELDEDPSDGNADLKGYELCSMCQAMFKQGKCSSAEEATTDMLTQVRTVIHGGQTQYHKVGIEGEMTLDAATIARVVDRTKELTCADDSAVWWDACSKLDCMNNMEGIDRKCKYRIASHMENPLAGSAELALKRNEELFFGMKKGSPVPSLLSMSYFHSHCGAGFDRRMVWLGCHFPAKRWCIAVGFSYHVKVGCEHNYRCNSTVPCLWKCGDAGTSEDWLEPYEKANSVFDTLVPRECRQPDISADGLDADSFRLQSRPSSCQPSDSTTAVETDSDIRYARDPRMVRHRPRGMDRDQ